MKTYTIQKIDTNLYVKGFSGQMVYKALYGILGALLLFVWLYILTGVFPAVLICIPAFFAWLFRLHRIQQKYGPDGWSKKRTSRQLPQFITIKQRICHYENNESQTH
ncbi:DUF4133 domain-containing protein [Mariniphaga sediminis]|nr:DUF4133 domain-containing protein [Mariniphaga sediminis]